MRRAARQVQPDTSRRSIGSAMAAAYPHTAGLATFICIYRYIGVYSAPHGPSASPETPMNILTVNLLLSTLVFAIAARLYLWPKLPVLDPKAVVLPILLLHALRHLGLMFLAPGAVFPGIPAQFAYPAAYGDLAAAVLALIAIPAVNRGSRLARPLVGLFNLEGSADLISAITLATVYDASPQM